MAAILLTACAPVGPDYVRPDITLDKQWPDYVHDEFKFVAQESVEWWQILHDPVLDEPSR